MTAIAFEYLEIRHCIYLDEDVRSFSDEAEFDRELAELSVYFADLPTGWTIYGQYADEAGQLLALAIGDFTEKADAFTIMNAILAPMAKARDKIRDGVDEERDNGLAITAAERAACDLEDFINQSSNHERL